MVADLSSIHGSEPATLEGDVEKPGSLTPPETRVRSTSSIIQRLNDLREADKIRAGNRTTIQGMADGNRPYAQSKLDAAGRGEQTNLNLREFEGMADAAKTPYYTLIFRQQRFINALFCYGDPVRRLEWSEKFSNRIHTLLEEWSGHDGQAQLRDWQMCVFGVGNVMFKDPRDWRWSALKISEVLVPDGTESDIEKLDEAAIPRRGGVSPVELYKLIKSEKAATTMGWFPDRVKEAIVKFAPESVRTQNGWGNQWGESWQSSLRCGDVMWNDKKSRVPIADYLVKEFNGKITHCIVIDDGVYEDATKDSRLLYKKVGCFESFDQVLCPFFFDIGTGEWHSVKGLGPKITDFCEVSNRLTGRQIDAARRTAGPILKAPSATAMEETQFIEIDGASVMAPDFEIAQFRMADSFNGMEVVKRSLENKMQSNTGQYRERVSAENQENTLGQAQLNEQNQAQLSGAAMDRFYKTLDRLYREQIRRILNPRLKENDPGGKEALECRKKMIEEDGIPEELLDAKHVKVKAVRGVGNGSMQMRLMMATELTKYLPMMNEQGRNYALRLVSSALAGQETAEQVFPRYGADQLPPDDHMALASIENAVLWQQGAEAEVTPMQNDAVHAQSHLAKGMMKGVKAMQEGQVDPVALLGYLHRMGPHVRIHLDKMAGDETRKGTLEPLEEAWQQMAALTDQLQQQIEEAAKSQEQQQPQLDPKMLKHLENMQVIQLDADTKRQKMLMDQERKYDDATFKRHLADLKTSHGIGLANAKTGSEIQRATATTVNDISLGRQESALKAMQNSAEPAGSNSGT